MGRGIRGKEEEFLERGEEGRVLGKHRGSDNDTEAGLRRLSVSIFQGSILDLHAYGGIGGGLVIDRKEAS